MVNQILVKNNFMGVGVERPFVEKEIPVGVSLVHGSNFSELLDDYGNPQDCPDANAVFAYNSEFSIHVGLLRSDEQRGILEEANISLPLDDVFLYNYKVVEPIKVVEFSDFEMLRTFIRLQTGFDYEENFPRVAEEVFALFPEVEGFVVLEDVLRSEPEVVLNERGLSKVSRQFKTQLQVKEEQKRTLDDMDTPLQCRVGGELGIGYKAELGGVLTTFQPDKHVGATQLRRTKSINLEQMLSEDSKEKTSFKGRRL